MSDFHNWPAFFIREAAKQDAEVKAALSAPGPQAVPFTVEQLRDQWNAQADEFNQWESLDLEEQLGWAQARAIAADRYHRDQATRESD